MRVVLLVAAGLTLASPPSFARVSQPLGRQPKVQSHLPQPPRLWQDRDGAFAISRPEGDRWAFRAGIKGPDGEVVPLIAVSSESGAQVVVQSADAVANLKILAGFLAQNLSREQRVHVEEPNRVVARGGEAYGFSFTVADEVRGRVAVVRAGDRVALLIASWPLGAPPEVADDVDEMIGSLGPIPGALPPGAF